MVTKRFIVKTRNIIDTSNEVDLEFETPLTNVKSIKLKSVKLCNSFHNISSNLGNNKVSLTSVSGIGTSSRRDDTIIDIADGFYNLMDIEKALNDSIKKIIGDIGDVQLKFKHDNSNNHVTISKQVKKDSPVTLFYISGELMKLLGFKDPMVIIPQISDYGMKINPFYNFYVHCNLIDKRTSYFNGYESDILCMLSVNRSIRLWDMVDYSNLDCSFNTNKNEINSMRIWITDGKNNQVDFNGYPIFYEFEIIEDDRVAEQANDIKHDSNFSCNINDDPETDPDET